MPGVTTRNRFENRASRGEYTLLIVCHAMSIAITTVLPVPVAIFSPIRGRPLLCSAFSASSRCRKSGLPWRPDTSARKIAVSAADQNATIALAQVSRANEGSVLEVVVDASLTDAAAVHDDVFETAIDAFRGEGGGHVTWWTDVDGEDVRRLAGHAGLALARSLQEMRIDLPMIDFFGRGGKLRPSWYGDCLPSRDFPLLVDLHLQGRLPLDRFVTERIGLHDVEEAFHRMERGEVLRSVVVL